MVEEEAVEGADGEDFGVPVVEDGAVGEGELVGGDAFHAGAGGVSVPWCRDALMILFSALRDLKQKRHYGEGTCSPILPKVAAIEWYAAICNYYEYGYGFHNQARNKLTQGRCSKACRLH